MQDRRFAITTDTTFYWCPERGLILFTNGGLRGENSLSYDDRLCWALNLASSADNAGVVVDDYGLLSVVALHFLKFEHRDRTHINTYRIAIAFVVVNFYFDHDRAPLKA